MNPKISKSISLTCLTALWGLTATPQSLAACANAQTATALRWDPVLRKQWLTTVDCDHPERPAQARLSSTSHASAQPVSRSDTPLTIRAGDRIRLTYQQSTTYMELSGIAEESGTTGSTIHVRLMQSTSNTNIPELRAIVRGPADAELQP